MFSEACTPCRATYLPRASESLDYRLRCCMHCRPIYIQRTRSSSGLQTNGLRGSLSSYHACMPDRVSFVKSQMPKSTCKHRTSMPLPLVLVMHVRLRRSPWNEDTSHSCQDFLGPLVKEPAASLPAASSAVAGLLALRMQTSKSRDGWSRAGVAASTATAQGLCYPAEWIVGHEGTCCGSAATQTACRAGLGGF